MSSSISTPIIQPGVAFDSEQDALHRIPAELTTLVHELVVTSDIIVISSRDSRKGLMGPVLHPGPATSTTQPESTFSFSSCYSSGLSSKTTFHEYRAVVQKHIINDQKCITLNVENMQFSNALQLLRTLHRRGKLPAFLRRPNPTAGQPNSVAAVRTMVIRHHITKNYPRDSSRIQKFHRQVQRLKNSEADLDMFHSFGSFFEDSVAIRQCIHDLGDAGTTKSTLQIDLIAKLLRDRMAVFDEEAGRADRIVRDNMALAAQMGAIRRAEAERLRAGDDVAMEMEMEMGLVVGNGDNGDNGDDGDDGDQVNVDNENANVAPVVARGSWGSMFA